MPTTWLIASDLHLDHRRDMGRAIMDALPEGDDGIIVAGDLAQQPGVIRSALREFCARWPHVIYVAGNHEHYERRLADVETLPLEVADECGNLHVLDATACEIDGVRYLGATLWFPESASAHRHEHLLSDFSLIPNFRDWLYPRHARDLRFLRDEVREGDVVVTHHLPAPGSVAPQYQHDELNCYFLADDAEDVIHLREPQAWVHGHTHDACTYKLGSTQVVCNPVGYPGERRAWEPARLTVAPKAEQ